MPGARERAPLAPRRRTRAGAADEAHRFLFGAHFGEGVEILRRRGAEDQALGDEQGSVEHGDPLFRLASGDASAARGAARQAHTLEDTGGKPVSSPSACAGWRGLEPTRETVSVSLAAAIFVAVRSEEHTSELQSLMRISYAVFCLKKKNNKNINV